jgi:hypothetical protein
MVGWLLGYIFHQGFSSGGDHTVGRMVAFGLGSLVGAVVGATGAVVQAIDGRK